jgi:hypothetical protein
VRKRGDKTTARCPACAESGNDKKGEHLVIYPRGSFACVLYPGDSADANEHRKRIFALCGNREIKPLTVRPAVLGRLGRVNEHHSAAETPLKTGLLGRLGRGFESHLEPGRGPAQQRKNHNVNEHERNDCEKGVLGVLSEPTSAPTPSRPLTETEHALLVRWCGADYHPLIIDAINLFDARIVCMYDADGQAWFI